MQAGRVLPASGADGDFPAASSADCAASGGGDTAACCAAARGGDAASGNAAASGAAPGRSTAGCRRGRRIWLDWINRVNGINGQLGRWKYTSDDCGRGRCVLNGPMGDDSWTFADS